MLTAVMAAAAALLLAGTGLEAQPDGSSKIEAVRSVPLPPPVVRARAPAQPVRRDWLVGRWTDDGDCTKVTAIRDDGTFVAPSGGQGRWSLDGNRLTLSGSQTVTLHVEAVDQNTLLAVLADGSSGQSTRC